ARLNQDGSLDTGFSSGTISDFVFAIAVQSDGAVVIGGEFTSIGGVSKRGIARLNGNGSLDPFFDYWDRRCRSAKHSSTTRRQSRDRWRFFERERLPTKQRCSAEH